MSAFQAGGALRPGAVYAARAADQALPRALLAGELAYVLAPRQMGKSSLLARAAARLRQQGVRVASLDLSTLGGPDATPERWFLGVLDELANELGLPDPMQGWLTRDALPPAQRWLRYLRHEVLGDGDQVVVVFCDEVDAALGLPADALIGAIRATVNLAASDPAWARLRFCLLGVATPAELVADPLRTPFNVGTSIRLEDLTRAEAAVFEPALAPYTDRPAELLDEIWGWTLGHPYMTQRLCAALAQEGPTEAPPATRVSALVAQLFLRPGPLGDINLASAARSLLARDRGTAALALYRRVWEGLAVPADEGDATVSGLLLTGMVARDPQGERAILRVRNPIFHEVFGRAWLEEHLGRRALLDATAEWVGGGRRDGDLLRGAALDRARSWSEGRPDLAPDEVALLLASAELQRQEEARRSREAQIEAERQGERARAAAAERHLATQRRLIRWLVAASALMAMALISAGLFYVRLRAAGAGLAEAERAQVQVWRESARLATLQPGRETEAVRYALLAAGQERRLDAELQPDTLLTLTQATAASSRGVRLNAGEASALLWTPDGRGLLIGGDDGALQRWDLSTRRRIQTWPGGSARVYSLARLRDGVASGDSDGLVRIYGWDGTLRRTINAHSGAPYHAVLALAGSPDEARLLSSGQDGAARIWDLASGQPLAELTGPAPIAWHQASLHSVAWSRDGARIAAGAEDSRVYVWDAESGALLSSFPTNKEQAIDIQFIDNDQILYGTLMGWAVRASLADGTEIVSWLTGKDSVADVTWDAATGTVLTANVDGGLRRWNDKTGALVQTTVGDVAGLAGIAVSPDGQQIAQRNLAGAVTVWRGRAQQAERRCEHPETILDACWLDAGTVATGAADHAARIWRKDAEAPITLAHPAAVTSVSGGGPRDLVTVDEEGVLRLWDLGARSVRAAVSLPSVAAQVLPTPDPQAWLVISKAGPVWRVRPDAATVETVLTARSRTQPGNYLSGLSADGAALVTPGENDTNTAELWTVQTGEHKGTLRGHEYPVRSAALSPDGTLVATGARDATVQIWDAAKGAAARTLLGHQDWVLSVGFAPDGRVLASGSVDGTAMLWDVALGQAYARFEDAILTGELDEGPTPVRRVALSPDGRSLLAIAGRDAWIYPVGPSALIAAACRELVGEREAMPAICDTP